MQSKTIIFDKKFNTFCRKYLFKNNGFDEKELAKTAIIDFYNIEIYVASLLLYYDCVCFDVYGENVQVPFLISMFGEKGFDALLEQNAIRFLLRTSDIMYPVEPLKGIVPIMPGGSYTTLIHSDPEASLQEGLSRVSKSYDRKYKRNITRKILKNFNTHPENLNAKIVGDVTTGYANNMFANLDLQNNKELVEFNKEDIEKLKKIGSNYFDLAILSYFKYTSLENYQILQLNNEELINLQKAKHINEYTDRIFKFEEIPNFEKLIMLGKIQIKDIPELRKKKNAVKFREWVASISNEEYESFETKDYLDAIDNSKTFWATNKGKATRSLSVFAVSTAITAPFTGPTSLGIGVAASLLDTFYIDSLTQNWNPRFYFKDDIEPLLKK